MMNLISLLNVFTMNLFSIKGGAIFLFSGMVSTWAAYALDFILPVIPFLVFIIFAIGGDMYLGVKVAKKEEKFTNWSNALSKSFNKTVYYAIGILVFRGFAITFFGDDLNLTWPAAFIIATTEVISVSRHIHSLTGVNMWDRIRLLMPTSLAKK